MNNSYQKLALTITINAIMMFFITYTLIDSLEHFHFNINRVYMTLLMVAPMVVLMILVMRSMFKNQQLNYVLIVAFIGLFALVFFFARTQTPVGNEQFLRSMIPHHSSAILMCEESNLTDGQILELCEEIVETQEREIAEMEEILARLNQ
jgi:RsiW-degrading membrane proteinase PrsW (M82 family)